MKTGILVWVVGYFPLAFVFDTYDACYEVEKSFERITAARTRPTFIQIYNRGYQAIVDYTPCIELLHIEKHLKNSEVN